jgi:hypothetical protein
MNFHDVSVASVRQSSFRSDTYGATCIAENDGMRRCVRLADGLQSRISKKSAIGLYKPVGQYRELGCFLREYSRRPFPGRSLTTQGIHDLEQFPFSLR